MRIRETTKSDLENVALCHINAFPESLSSKLGLKYCKKMLEWYLTTDKAFLYHLEKNSYVIGYFGGIINDGTLNTGSTSAMIQYTFYEAIFSFLKKPMLFLHKEMRMNYSLLLKNLFHKIGIRKRKKNNKTIISQKVNPYIGLVVIGVKKNSQGSGYGSLLLRHFEKISKEYDVKKITLSVKSFNIKAIEAYERNGWERISEKDKIVSMCKYIN